MIKYIFFAPGWITKVWKLKEYICFLLFSDNNREMVLIENMEKKKKKVKIFQRN